MCFWSLLSTPILPNPPTTTSTIRGLLPRLPPRIPGFKGRGFFSGHILRLPHPAAGDPARQISTGCAASRAMATPSPCAPPRTLSPLRAASAFTLGPPSLGNLLRPQQLRGHTSPSGSFIGRPRRPRSRSRASPSTPQPPAPRLSSLPSAATPRPPPAYRRPHRPGLRPWPFSTRRSPPSRRVPSWPVDHPAPPPPPPRLRIAGSCDLASAALASLPPSSPSLGPLLHHRKALARPLRAASCRLRHPWLPRPPPKA